MLNGSPMHKGFLEGGAAERRLPSWMGLAFRQIGTCPLRYLSPSLRFVRYFVLLARTVKPGNVKKTMEDTYKSLFGHALQPRGARNHCSCVLRSHLALEIAVRVSFFVSTTLENAPQHCLFAHSARNHCSGVLSSHWTLEIPARVSLEAT